MAVRDFRIHALFPRYVSSQNWYFKTKKWLHIVPGSRKISTVVTSFVEETFWKEFALKFSRYDESSFNYIELNTGWFWNTLFSLWVIRCWIFSFQLLLLIKVFEIKKFQNLFSNDEKRFKGYFYAVNIFQTLHKFLFCLVGQGAPGSFKEWKDQSFNSYF